MAINRYGEYEATDQASLTWVESQAARLEPGVKAEVMAKINWPEIVPIYRDMSIYEDYLVTYISRPGTGRMTPLSNGGEDLPSVDVEFDRMQRQVYDSGISYSFTDKEIGKARKLGVNLRGEKIKAAYRVANEHIEQAVLFGNTDYGWRGLLNYPTTGTDSARHVTTTAWTDGDTTAPFETIRDAFNAVWADSRMIETPDTLLVPPKALTFLTKMLQTSAGITSISVWDYIRENNPGSKLLGRPLMIKPINELDTAGPSSTPRMVLYSSNSEALRLILPQELMFIAPQRVGFAQKFYGSMCMGGVQYLRPKSICIIDGFGANL